jgi:hypothetical protein
MLPSSQAMVPRLKSGAIQSWPYPHHPGWAIYFKVLLGVGLGVEVGV